MSPSSSHELPPLLASAGQALESVKTLRITDADTDETFDIYLFPNSEPSALAMSVCGRAGISSMSGFYLTSNADPNGACVPLSCTLMENMSLILHRSKVERHRSNATTASASAMSTTHEQPNTAASPLAMDRPLTPSATSFGMSEPLLSHMNPVISGSSPDSSAPPPIRRSGTTHVAQQIEGLERLSRLTTDLANERTLLAWIRTCLASIRTLFAYLALSASTAAWEASITCAQSSRTLPPNQNAALSSVTSSPVLACVRSLPGIPQPHPSTLARLFQHRRDGHGDFCHRLRSPGCVAVFQDQEDPRPEGTACKLWTNLHSTAGRASHAASRGNRDRCLRRAMAAPS